MASDLLGWTLSESKGQDPILACYMIGFDDMRYRCYLYHCSCMVLDGTGRTPPFW